MPIQWTHILTIPAIFLLSACEQGSQLMNQAQNQAGSLYDLAKQAGVIPDSVQQAADTTISPRGASTARVEIKNSIDPQFTFVQTYLSGLWVQEPYKRGCDRESILKGERDGKDDGGHYVEFSFDGNAVTQYDHYVSHGHENILATVAIIKSASQSNKNLGSGRTKIGEVLVTPQGSKMLSGISGNSGTPQGFSKPKIFLVSGDFSAEEPDFSGKAIYSNGVAGGPPQLYSCSGTFERRE